MKLLVLLLQFLDLAEYFFDFHIVFKIILYLLQLIHQLNLSPFFKLQNPTHKLLFLLASHHQKQDKSNNFTHCLI